MLADHDRAAPSTRRCAASSPAQARSSRCSALPDVTDVLVNGAGPGLRRPRRRAGAHRGHASPTRPPCAGWPSGWPPPAGRRLDDSAPSRRRPARRRHPLPRRARAAGPARHACCRCACRTSACSTLDELVAAGTLDRPTAPAAAVARLRAAGVPGQRRHRLRQDHPAELPALLVDPTSGWCWSRTPASCGPTIRTSSASRPGRRTSRAPARSRCAPRAPGAADAARPPGRRRGARRRGRRADGRPQHRPRGRLRHHPRQLRARRPRPASRPSPWPPGSAARRRTASCSPASTPCSTSAATGAASVGSTRCTCWKARRVLGGGDTCALVPRRRGRHRALGSRRSSDGWRRRRERRAPGRGSRGARADGRAAAARSLRADRRPTRRDGPWIRDVVARRPICGPATRRMPCPARVVRRRAARRAAGRDSPAAGGGRAPGAAGGHARRDAPRRGRPGRARRGQRQRGPAGAAPPRRVLAGRRGHRRRARRRCDTPGGGEPGVRADRLERPCVRPSRAPPCACSQGCRRRGLLLGTGLGADTVGWLVGTGPGRVVLTLGLLLDGVGLVRGPGVVAGVEAAL